MFKIRGADGREYGPVSTEQLRQWVREGRAGAQTQVQSAGATMWSPLSALPEFAELFAAPPAISGTPAAMPPVVQTVAYGFFIVAAISGLWLLLSVVTTLRYVGNGNFHPGFPFYLACAFGAVSLPVRVITGIGLLRARDWARRLAVACGIILALYGVWGLVQTFLMFSRVSDPSILFRSPMFLLSHVWSLGVLAFNIGTAMLLSRPSVRAAFVQKAPAAA